MRRAKARSIEVTHDARSRGHAVSLGIDVEKAGCTSGGRKWYSGGQAVDPEEACDVARRYVRQNREHNQSKKLEAVLLSHSTPAKLEEREPALLAAVFRVSASSSGSRRGIVDGVSKLRSLTRDISRTRSAWVDNLTGGGSIWRSTAAASCS
jgi:hypothetical protein